MRKRVKHPIQSESIRDLVHTWNLGSKGYVPRPQQWGKKELNDKQEAEVSHCGDPSM